MHTLHALAGDPDCFRIDVSCYRATGAHKQRGGRKDARTSPDVEYRIARAHMTFYRLEAELRARVATGSARHSGINFQAKASRGSWIGRPGGNQKEAFPNLDRWPSVPGDLGPIGESFLPKLG